MPETKTEAPGKKRLIAAIVLLIIAAVLFALFAFLAGALMTLEPSETEDAGEAAGQALGFAFAFVLILIFEVCIGSSSLILDLISLSLSARVIAVAEGKRRVTAIVVTTLAALIAVTTIVIFIVSVTV